MTKLLKPVTLDIYSLLEIEIGDKKEKYIVMEQSGTEQQEAIEATLRPVMKGSPDIIIRFLGK